MVDKTVHFGFRIKHWFTYHPWLKLISLLLAVILWFYVKGELLRLLY